MVVSDEQRDAVHVPPASAAILRRLKVTGHPSINRRDPNCSLGSPLVMRTHALSAALTGAAATALVFAGNALAAASSAANEDAENAPLNLGDVSTNQQQATGGGGGGIVRTIVGLAIVIAVIYGVYWVLKQVKSSKEGKVSGSGLNSLATLPLGPNRSVHVIRAGREVLVVGVAEHNIVPLRAYTEDQARAVGLLDGHGDVALSEARLPPAGRSVAELEPETEPRRVPATTAERALDTMRRWTERR
jgi:flagellar protein FliO/FliZ